MKLLFIEKYGSTFDLVMNNQYYYTTSFGVERGILMKVRVENGLIFVELLNSNTSKRYETKANKLYKSKEDALCALVVDKIKDLNISHDEIYMTFKTLSKLNKEENDR